MIESSLIQAMKADEPLKALLSQTSSGDPSIFSEFAPEKKEYMYVVFRVDRMVSSPDFIVENFNINVDIYDYGTARGNSRKAAQRVEFIFDGAILEHDRYNSIRTRFESGGPVLSDDPRSIHYNIQLSARACRKAWAAQI